MQKDDNVMQSIILAGPGILVKSLKTLELHHIFFIKFCIYVPIHLNIVLTLVCKTIMMRG